MEPVIVSTVVWLVLLFGLAGTMLPILPGVGLIFAGIALYALYFGIDEIGMVTLIILGGVAVFSLVLDHFASIYGAVRFGSTKWGVIGSIVGGLFGVIVLNIPGLVLGIFFGAVAGELVFAKKDLHQSLRVGWGSVLGFLGGTVLKFILGVAMVVTFIVKVYF
jgi:uncharacterized protein YqgC (DUF456 family)